MRWVVLSLVFNQFGLAEIYNIPLIQNIECEKYTYEITIIAGKENVDTIFNLKKSLE